MMSKALFFLALGLWSALPVLAGDVPAGRLTLSKLDPALVGFSEGGTAARSGEDRQLEMKKTDFLAFAAEKIGEMNRNLLLSRDRMRIEPGPDGLYRARFHEIDGATLGCQVSRSQTVNSPYVAVLSYRELVYAASCATPDSCRQGTFQPVAVIPNRHIFVYINGAWQ